MDKQRFNILLIFICYVRSMEYIVKTGKLGSSRYNELKNGARHIFREIEKRTKRRPYVRSAYFNKEKIFFEYFWQHLNQKPIRERRGRLRYLPCGLELIQHSRLQPIVTINRNRPRELLYRFVGKTLDGEIFYVQIKQDTKINQKQLMSIFSK